jgi:pimeloyl-ACP methyl ester carboxylesterase
MELNYRSYGNGFPLIILHGLFGMLDNWHTVSSMLSTDFRVIALDQRNHGRSPHSTEFNYQVMARDVRDFMEHHSLKSCYLLGHSMGGKTAMHIALHYPQLIDKLVVVDIAPRAYPSMHDSILEALASVDPTKYSSRREIDGALLPRIPEPGVRQFLMKNLARTENGVFHWKMNLPIIASNYQEILKKVTSEIQFTKPVLVVRSTKSKYVEDSDLVDFRSLFPNSHVVDFDTGHWVHAEAPEQLTKVVSDFLKRSVI